MNLINEEILTRFRSHPIAWQDDWKQSEIRRSFHPYHQALTNEVSEACAALRWWAQYGAHQTIEDDARAAAVFLERMNTLPTLDTTAEIKHSAWYERNIAPFLKDAT